MAVDSPVVLAHEDDGGLPYGSGGSGGLLPWYIVVPVQLVAMFWELGVVAIVTLPWWSILASIATLDWILDWVFLFTIGLICRPCAGLFIWILNILMLPFMIWGYIQRFFLETFGLIIDGWMLAFNFSGCYFIFGHHCWHTPRSKHRNMRTLWDIPLMWVDPSIDNLKALVLPTTEEMTQDEFLQVRAANRQPLLNILPVYSQAMSIYGLLKENIDF